MGRWSKRGGVSERGVLARLGTRCMRVKCLGLWILDSGSSFPSSIAPFSLPSPSKARHTTHIIASFKAHSLAHSKLQDERTSTTKNAPSPPSLSLSTGRRPPLTEATYTPELVPGTTSAITLLIRARARAPVERCYRNRRQRE